MTAAGRTISKRILAMGAIVLMISALNWLANVTTPAPWTASEMTLLESLWIGSLPAPPADPSNAVADVPLAAALGKRLFFDPRLSANGAVSCATCHQPQRRFTDGRPKGFAIGESRRNTPSIVATAYSPWLYWDGRKDSQWSQALAPLEDPNEHASNRTALAHLIRTDPGYRRTYQTLFGALPDLADASRFPPAASPAAGAAAREAWNHMTKRDRHLINQVFANIGKAIAAYERQLMPGPSRFDGYVKAVLAGDEARAADAMNASEVHGLKLFIGRGQCVQCHNGPLLTNHEFHNTGVLSAPGEVPDRGRIAGLRGLREDPFNCLGRYSDDPERHCPELEFARSGPELLGAMRTPSLRNLEGTAPFMHKGQLADTATILEHYNRAPAAMIGHNEAKPLGLGRDDLKSLDAFLRTLATPASEPAGSDAAEAQILDLDVVVDAVL
jgi:cytochrome c peroxidase